MKYKIYRKGEKEFVKAETKFFNRKIEYRLRNFHFVENGTRNIKLYLLSFLFYIPFIIFGFATVYSLFLILVTIPQVVIFFEERRGFLDIRVRYETGMRYYVSSMISDKKSREFEKKMEIERKKEEKEKKKQEKIAEIELSEVYVNESWLDEKEVEKIKHKDLRIAKFKRFI